MKSNKSNIIVAILLIFVLQSCNNSQNENNYESSFKFLVLSDIHISDSDSKTIKLQKFVNDFNNTDSINNGVDLIITTGDNVSYLFSDRNWNRDSLPNNKLRTFTKTMSELKVPYFLCMGNHEYKIDQDRDSDGFFPKNEILKVEKIWKEETDLGCYYSVKQSDYNLIFLNTMRGRYQDKFLDSTQVEWFKNEIAQAENVILFFHHPLRTDSIDYWYKKTKGTITKEKEPQFYEILASNKAKIKGIFAGHGHMWMHDKLFETIKVYETASFGDHDEYMYYTVEVSGEDITVSKSVDTPYFEGFFKELAITH